MWKRPHSSRTGVERTGGGHGVERLSANASENARCDAAIVAGRFSARAMLAALATAVLLGACGGGVYLALQLGDPGDEEPSVALTAAVSEAAAGATVRLAAAASDDFGVDAVSFYRENGTQAALLLGSDGLAPYEFDTVIPASSPGTVWRYFARAVDGAGQRSDSAVVEITVR
jgi:hypothetical protein